MYTYTTVEVSNALWSVSVVTVFIRAALLLSAALHLQKEDGFKQPNYNRIQHFAESTKIIQ